MPYAKALHLFGFARRGHPVASASQCCSPLRRCAPPDSSMSRCTTGLVAGRLAGEHVQPLPRKELGQVGMVRCHAGHLGGFAPERLGVVKTGAHLAEGPLGPGRVPKTRVFIGRCGRLVRAGHRRAQGLAASRAASAASSSWRPGDSARCQAQSAAARPSDTGESPPVSGAMAACVSRSSFWVGVSVEGAASWPGRGRGRGAFGHGVS